jgi:hypothetical protein
MKQKRTRNPFAAMEQRTLATLFGLLATVSLVTPAWSQTTVPRLMVSPSADLAATATLPAISDGSLVAVGGGGAPAPHFVDGHWLANTGIVPRDVDAFTRMPGIAPGRNLSMVFSFQSDEHGFLDGDILSINHSGGVKVIYAEAGIARALGLPDANIDIDAMCFDDLGQLIFSLQSDLDGTVIGSVKDGDVLRFLASGTVSLVIDEAGVQSDFTTATGLTGAIGDVLGVEMVSGELWVTTQGPTSHDGGVLRCGSSPQVIAEEAALGLGGAEIDALSVVDAGEEIPTIHIDKSEAFPGDTFHAVIRGAPNSEHAVFISGASGFVDYDWLPGWGACYMDPFDPWLQVFIASPMLNYVRCDGSGVYEIDFLLPIDPWWGLGFGGEQGWTFQMFDLATAEFSAPIRVEKL